MMNEYCNWCGTSVHTLEKFCCAECKIKAQAKKTRAVKRLLNEKV